MFMFHITHACAVFSGYVHFKIYIYLIISNYYFMLNKYKTNLVSPRSVNIKALLYKEN